MSLSSQKQEVDLSVEEWKILHFHEDKNSVKSSQIQRELSLDQRVVLDSLHNLHYQGLISFKEQYLGKDESILSKITLRGLELAKTKTG